MSSAQDRIVLAATVAVESVWFYAAFSILALLMSLPGSPMAWIAAAAIMGVSLIVARTLYVVIMPTWMPYTVQMVLGVLVIYLTLGTQFAVSWSGFRHWLDHVCARRGRSGQLHSLSRPCGAVLSPALVERREAGRDRVSAGAPVVHIQDGPDCLVGGRGS